MKREIIVNSSLVETRVAVIEDGTLVETPHRRLPHTEPGGEYLQGPGAQDPAGDAGRLRGHRSGSRRFPVRPGHLRGHGVVRGAARPGRGGGARAERGRAAAPRGGPPAESTATELPCLHRGVDPGGTGGPGPGCPGAPGDQGGPHHLARHAARALPGVHADGVSRRRLAEDRGRGRAIPPETDHRRDQRAAGGGHRPHGRRGPLQGGDSGRLRVPSIHVAGDQGQGGAPQGPGAGPEGPGPDLPHLPRPDHARTWPVWWWIRPSSTSGAWSTPSRSSRSSASSCSSTRRTSRSSRASGSSGRWRRPCAARSG